MSGFALVVVLAALFAFGAGMMAAIIMPAARFWRYVDPVYYVLSACGVVLVALTVDRNLAAERVALGEPGIEDAWRAPPDAKPWPDRQIASREMVDVSLQGLQTAVQRADICEYGGKYDCLIFRPIKGAVDRAYSGLLEPAGKEGGAEARYESDYCTRSFSLVDQLAARSDLLDGGAFDALKQVLLGEMKTHATEEQAVAELGSRIDRSQQAVRREMDGSSAEAANALFAGYKNFSILELKMIGFCAEAPVRNTRDIAQVGGWRRENGRRARIFAKMRQQLDAAVKMHAKTLAQAVSVFLHNEVWPFLLIFATAIKFGKSIAELRR